MLEKIIGFFKPKNTFTNVTKALIDGLEDGSIVLKKENDLSYDPKLHYKDSSPRGDYSK